jgi:hypothetical protein
MEISKYTADLQSLPDWTPYLLQHSGLPGPRGNLELAEAAARLGPLRLEPYLALSAQDAPENTPQTFLVFCGVLGLGMRLAGGEAAALVRLKRFANDPRWRVREGVATALQMWGDAQPPALLAEMRRWAGGSWLEQRAAVAALCEPRLLRTPASARETLAILDDITAYLAAATERHDPGFVALRKALAYGWSVAAGALLGPGKLYFERWSTSPDPDVRWLLRENLKKNRLLARDPAWVEAIAKRLV